MYEMRHVHEPHDRALLRAITGPADPLQHLLPQSLWLQQGPHLRRWRCSLCRALCQTGMWLERFVIVVTSLQRDYLPSSWGMYWSPCGTS